MKSIVVHDYTPSALPWQPGASDDQSIMADPDSNEGYGLPATVRSGGRTLFPIAHLFDVLNPMPRLGSEGHKVSSRVGLTFLADPIYTGIRGMS